MLTPSIEQTLLELAAAKARFALVVVLRVEGSAPQKPGAKMLVSHQGRLHGTVGGGQVEAEGIRRALASLQSGQPQVFDFNLDSRLLAEGKPICGGTMRLLIVPDPARHQTAFTACETARQQRQRGVLQVAIRHDGEALVEMQFRLETEITDDLPFPGAAALRKILEQETPALFVAGHAGALPRQEVWVEPRVPCPQAVIVGGGHVGQAVAWQANQVGFEVVVLDDRPEFTAPELYPQNAGTRGGDVVQELARFAFTPETYVIIVTRGHRQDAAALAVCLRQPVAYLGMIGSRRKVQMVRQEFLESGRVTAAEWDRIYAPIGLDIGAVTVPEIATSIVAQLIAVRRTGRAPRIR